MKPPVVTIPETPFSRKDRICRRIIDVGILALLVWTPLPLASVEEWAVLIIELAALVLFGAYLLMDRKPKPSAGFASRLRGTGYALTALLGLVALQLVPLPAAVVQFVSPHAAVLRDAFAPGVAPRMTTLSLLPGRTLASGLELAAYVLIGVVVVKTATHRRQFRRIMTTLVAMGVFEALYGLFEMMRRNPRLLLYKKELMLDSATGTFVNRNHFSAYLELILPLAAGLIISRLDLFSGQAPRWRDRLARLAAKGTASSVIAGVGIVVMGVAILRSNSRSGAMILGFIFLLFLTLGSWHFGMARLNRAWALRILKIGLLAVLVFALYGGVETMVGRFSLDRLLQDGRPQYWGKTLTMAADFPLAGVGLGSFGQVYQAYDTFGMEYALVHAHNDYLEVLAELGVVGFLLLFGAIAFIFADAIRTWIGRRNPEIKGLALGGIVSAAALFIHSLTDFNLRIPANALVFTVVLALSAAVVHHRRA
jgi:hypothetical protein